MFDDIIRVFEGIKYDDIFITDTINDTDHSYSDFFGRALALAGYIDLNVSGDMFIAVKENSYELALIYFATMFTDKKIAVIDPQKGNEEIKNLLYEMDGTGIFADTDEVSGLSEKHSALSIPCEVGKTDLKDIKERIIRKIQARDMEAPFLVTFTSGTNGLTKGVEHSLKNLFLSAFALAEKVEKRKGCFLHVMPMTYMAGILNSLIYPFVIGSRIVIDRRFSIASSRFFWNTVVKYGADLFWLSPSMLMMIDRLDRKEIGEEYCRKHNPVFLIGTAPLSNEMRDRFNNRYGVSVYASYGLSETLFVSVETPESQKRSEKNSVGELLTGVDFNILDSGEMLIDVPWMFLRYTNEDTEQYFSGNYYKSGDLVEIRDGCLYVTGRSKDLIIKGGMNISPVLIENVVDQNENILESVVVGVRDKTKEEKVCCAYVTEKAVEDIKGFESAVKNTVIEQLGRNYSIDYMWNIKSIPRNINGKTDKIELVRMWEKMNDADR